MQWIRAMAVALAVAAALAGYEAAARTCTRADIGDGVDHVGGLLRKINADTFPAIQEKMRQLKELKGWSESDYQEQAATLLQDARTEQLDSQSNDLLMRIDSIGSEKLDGADVCARLDELEAATTELGVVMRAKATYALTRLDAMIIEGQGAKGPRPKAPVTAEAERPKAPPVAAPAAPRAAAPPQTAMLPQGGWTTRTETEAPPPAEAAPAVDPEGYTIDEIRDATRGFFGQVSTGLASVIEHAFSKSGRPVGYVLGNEGGGAFLAGLRYGKGTLYLRSGGTRDVFWHGPSIGYDVGVSGAKTMFLIYNLKTVDDLFARFSGIEGSAYVVGGVGMTFLTDGRVVMAPIRSGLGLRLGANIGYVRFTRTQTWNPF